MTSLLEPVSDPITDPIKVSESLIKEGSKFSSDIKKYVASHIYEYSPEVLLIASAVSENEPFLENVEKMFEKIVVDKKMNALDIPLIVILLQEMFVLFQNSSFRFNTAVLKMLFLVLVSENMEGKLTPSEQALIMNTIDAVLECCIQLVEWKEKNPSVGKSKFCCF